MPAAPLRVACGTLAVSFDAADDTFAVSVLPSGRVFARRGRLDGSPLDAAVADAADPVFGRGRRIVLRRSGGEVALELYEGLPFLLLRQSVRNDGDAELDLRRVVPAVVALDLGLPAAGVLTLGTGGLLPPQDNPGSYLFLTVVDPRTRRGVVAGWLTQDRGSGVFFSGVRDGAVELRAQVDYGHLRLPPGRGAELETLALGCFDDARLGEEAYADALRRRHDIRLRPPEAAYCTWYAEGKGHGKAGDARSTVELAAFLARELAPFGLATIQVDDGWQDGPLLDGPARGFERPDPAGPYAGGIAPVAAALARDGVRLGLWWLPFGRNHEAPAYAGRGHWFARRADGGVLRTKAFGGTCLDLTHPEVREHLAGLARLLRGWGVGYFKMDGAWTGTATEVTYINDGYVDDRMDDVAPFHDPGVTQVEAYRQGWRLLRAHAGPEVFFSACCISQNMRSITAVGLVDAMRVGPDFNHDGQGIRTGPLRATRLYFLNGRVWWNDPDPIKVRASDEECEGDSAGRGGVTLAQARLGASWVSLSGQFFLVSDWLPALPPERLEVLRRTLAHHGAVARPVDAFDRDLPCIWLVTDADGGVRRDVIGVFNFQEEALAVRHDLGWLGLAPARAYHAFDFWAGEPLPEVRGEFAAVVPPCSCLVVAVRAALGRPLVVSTSRHVTQGMVDLRGEAWADGVLSGRSTLVAGDPYEVRIAGLADGGDWEPVSCALAAADLAAGARAALARTPGLLRLAISCPVGREVSWSIRFERRPAGSAPATAAGSPSPAAGP